MKIIDFDELKKSYRDSNRPSWYSGLVYVFEIGDCVKIGYSAKPYERLTILRRSCEAYGDNKTGRLAVTEWHTSYRQTERDAHSLLSEYRVGNTELFRIDFDKAIDAVDSLSDRFEYDDEELLAKSDAISEAMINFVKGYTQITSNSESSVADVAYKCADDSTAISFNTLDGDEFGSIRYVVLDGDVWFVGRDIAYALGYMNPRSAIKDHVDQDEKMVVEAITPGGKQPIVIINDFGAFSLALSSRSSTAKDFRHWLTHDVLPVAHARYVNRGSRMVCTGDDFPHRLRRFADEIEMVGGVSVPA